MTDTPETLRFVRMREGVWEPCSLDEFLADCDTFGIYSDGASAHVGAAARVIRALLADREAASQRADAAEPADFGLLGRTIQRERDEERARVQAQIQALTDAHGTESTMHQAWRKRAEEAEARADAAEARILGMRCVKCANGVEPATAACKFCLQDAEAAVETLRQERDRYENAQCITCGAHLDQVDPPRVGGIEPVAVTVRGNLPPISQALLDEDARLQRRDLDAVVAVVCARCRGYVAESPRCTCQTPLPKES